MKRTPWFNARRDPPVNGGRDSESEYEWKCVGRRHAERRTKEWIIKWGKDCPHCQWRGLTAPAKERT